MTKISLTHEGVHKRCIKKGVSFFFLFQIKLGFEFPKLGEE